jgi:nicotinamidase-related amidase
MKQLGIAGSLERVLSNRKNSARPPFAEALKPADNDVVFEKFSPSAFLGTNFEWRLRSRGVQTVIIAGISLETGVEGTAREALNRGFYAVIVRDCSSTSERENYDLAMPIIERLFDVADSQDIIRAWESSTDHQRQSSLDK